MSNFYCQRVCGFEDFSIDEWNKKYKQAISMGLNREEMNHFLGDKGTKCKVQCDGCACIVGEQRLKTQKLVDKLKSK